MTPTKTEVMLDDVNPGMPQFKCSVNVYPTGIGISFEGFGENGAMPGYGEPVFVEVKNGVPTVYLWSDINSEDPTHVVSLGGARESLYKEKADG